MNHPNPTAVQLSQATAGNTYQVCHNNCSDSLGQKLTLMGLGLGMVIELLALYKHGAVVKTPFGHIAVGTDLVNAISVSLV
ncbi:ferrous iron transport protein A [Marinicella meishanensis]|uniref:ferrous iron transport protein A n=1 Tax=Marinicella meishanensis TaxID=2873263 RepID=UPI001CBBEC0C|nr:ferrous iron transport protein A [Marinicella sp. NBU2979]